jgi:putative glycosyltransferase (TIGR04348 family)
MTVPPSAGARSGNWRSAARWTRMLRSLGHRVRAESDWKGGDDEVLIALHARKSYASIARFRAERPDRPIVLVLTGTDVYRDIRSDPQAQAALDMAARIVVLPEEALAELSPALRRRAQVLHQSCDTLLRPAPPAKRFRIAVVAHLREEKDPFCAARALVHLPDLRALELLQIGEALDSAMAIQCAHWTRQDPRYRWLGSVPHHLALRWMSRSHALVVSSVMEGGANVISEAVRIGVPVLASRIPGNIGMLGAAYRGYYPVADDRALARLIERSATQPRFYDALRSAVERRRGDFTPAGERAAWREVLNRISAR